MFCTISLSFAIQENMYITHLSRNFNGKGNSKKRVVIWRFFPQITALFYFERFCSACHFKAGDHFRLGYRSDRSGCVVIAQCVQSAVMRWRLKSYGSTILKDCRPASNRGCQICEGPHSNILRRLLHYNGRLTK